MVNRWRPSRQLLAIALFISLIVNLFLGGLIAGRLIRGEDWPWPNPYVREFGPFAGRALDHLLRHLDGADRKLVLDTIRVHEDELSRLSKAMHDQRNRVKQLLRAPELDRPAVEQAFAEMRKRGDDMQDALGAAMLEAIEKLPPEARQRLGR